MTSTGIGRDKGLEKRLAEGKVSIVAAFAITPIGPLPGRDCPARAFLRFPDGQLAYNIPLWTMEGKTRQEIKDELCQRVDTIFDNTALVWQEE